MYWLGKQGKEKAVCVCKTEVMGIKIVEIPIVEIDKRRSELFVLPEISEAKRLRQIIQRYDGICVDINNL